MFMGSGLRVVAVLASAAALIVPAAPALAQVSGGATATKPGAIENQLTRPDFNKGSAMELPARSGTTPPKSNPPAASPKPGMPADVLTPLPGVGKDQKK